MVPDHSFLDKVESQNKSLTGESASEEFAQQVHEESNPDLNLSQRSLITKRVE